MVVKASLVAGPAAAQVLPIDKGPCGERRSRQTERSHGQSSGREDGNQGNGCRTGVDSDPVEKGSKTRRETGRYRLSWRTGSVSGFARLRVRAGPGRALRVFGWYLGGWLP